MDLFQNQIEQIQNEIGNILTGLATTALSTVQGSLTEQLNGLFAGLTGLLSVKRSLNLLLTTNPEYITIITKLVLIKLSFNPKHL